MQNRPRNLHSMRQPKKKIQILPFILVFIVVVLVILAFWLSKRNKTSTMAVNEQLNNQVTFTPTDTLESGMEAEFTPDSIQSPPVQEDPALTQSEADNAPPVQTSPNVTASDIQQFSDQYDQALRYFYSENYTQAISILSDLVEKYPNHEFQVNCQHWMGECYFGLQDYDKALTAFKKVLSYGETYKTDDALLMTGRCYQRMNDKMNARLYFQRVLNEYPMSEFAAKARKHLARL